MAEATEYRITLNLHILPMSANTIFVVFLSKWTDKASLVNTGFQAVYLGLNGLPGCGTFSFETEELKQPWSNWKELVATAEVNYNNAC